MKLTSSISQLPAHNFSIPDTPTIVTDCNPETIHTYLNSSIIRSYAIYQPNISLIALSCNSFLRLIPQKISHLRTIVAQYPNIFEVVTNGIYIQFRITVQKPCFISTTCKIMDWTRSFAMGVTSTICQAVEVLSWPGQEASYLLTVKSQLPAGDLGLK